MKKAILIVEDLIDEQKKAKEAVSKMNFRPLVASNLDEAKMMLKKFKHLIRGIITDIHFPIDEKSDTSHQPNGLAVVALAVKLGIPISICSDINGHYAFFVFDVAATLSEHSNCFGNKIPVTVSSKNWQIAINELENLIRNNPSQTEGIGEKVKDL